MKLEMRAWDLDVKVELEDDESLDPLEVFTTVKTLLETLVKYEKVSVSVQQIVDPEDDNDEDDEEDDEQHEEVNHLSVVA